MQFSILVTSLLATAVAASPIDLLNLEPDTYPTSTTTTPHGGYPTTTGYPTGYPTSSTTKPGGGHSSSTTKPGGGHSSSTTKPGGGHSSSTTKPGGGSSTTTTPGGGSSTTSSTTTPGGGSTTSSTTTPGGGSTTSSTTTTTPGGGSPTSSTTSPGTPYPTGGYFACPSGLYSVEQCCATDILGVADLDCHSPSAVPSSAANFQAICAAGGQRARCCVIPILGQAVLCETPAGVV
ncbi:hypothetical protein E0Z10_g1295 [Xylaria hypoxylon]|uniref:Hydrophobin n=1 Tax=Xylaria hypoxylon TaxID=37992 RepID=A0A4Z0YST0_9PEZI|nr:hypothetical protein E0Z10_g1295 [Xylaria hypoxylon]